MGRIPIDDDVNNPEEENMQQASHDDQDAVVGDDETAALRAERDSLYERLARATAEFQNIRKRNEQEREQQIQYGNSSLIKSLLPVIDNFERALNVDPSKADTATLLKGMQIVHDQWLSVLKQQDVEEIAPVPGTPFDPNQHQALMQQDSQYEVPTVVQLLQKGYALHGRTLRPAQVAVSRTT